MKGLLRCRKFFVCLVRHSRGVDAYEQPTTVYKLPFQADPPGKRRRCFWYKVLVAHVSQESVVLDRGAVNETTEPSRWTR